jgi:AraC-like DNA-binding protein
MNAIAEQGRFHDADAWCEAVNDWNLDFRQLDAGPLDGQIERVLDADLALQRVSLSRRFHQQGVAPPGVLTFGIPLGGAPVRWSGTAASAGQFMNFNDPGGFDAVTETDFRALTVSLAEDDLDRTLAALGVEAEAAQAKAGPALFGHDPREVHALIEIVQALMVRMTTLPRNAPALRELKSQLRFTLAEAMLGGQPDAPRTSRSQRQHAVDRAVSLIRHARDMPTIEELHRHCETSYRTLNRGFRERFGITPKQYLLRARLSAAQRALLRARPGTRVTAIASDIGFWHLGRFASAYARMFGERPSATLTRGQGSRAPLKQPGAQGLARVHR